MDGEDLMTVGRAHLDTGLRGIPVGTCRTSFVTPEDGVHYVGYPIEDLVDLDPMDVIHLLFEKDLPDPEQSCLPTQPPFTVHANRSARPGHRVPAK